MPDAIGKIAVGALKIYKAFVSPWLPRACRFTPSCSEYARACFEGLSAARAFWFSARRLARCHPLCAGGFDPPPVGEKGTRV